MFNENLLNTLKFLGFNMYEAKVYVSMLTQSNPHTAYEIAKLLPFPRNCGQRDKASK